MPKINVHKIGSSTCGHLLDHEVEYTHVDQCRPGDIVVVKALEEKRVYDQLELVGGRLAHISKDDIIAGTLGSRHALRGFVGHCPQDLKPGQELHILNLGGVIGIATSANSDLGAPLSVQLLGTAVRGGDQVINISENAVPPSETLTSKTPIILVAGTCMGAGKTRAAVEIIAQLNQRGFTVGGMKLSGVAALRDTLNMQDHGAVCALSFLDAGFPSTAGFSDLAPMAKGLINKLSDMQPLDAIVVELGDGIIGGYAVDSFYKDEQLRNAIKVHVMTATDLVAAWGAREVAKGLGRAIDIMTGPATDNSVGEQYVDSQLGIPGANARTRGSALADFVAMRVFGKETNR